MKLMLMGKLRKKKRMKLRQLSFLLTLIPLTSWGSGKFSATAGYFSINAKTDDESVTVSNPSAFHLSFSRPLTEKLEGKIGYSMLVADFSGSDFGYGFDFGVNYFIKSSAYDETYKDDTIKIVRFENWSPYVGLGFYQRNFQSIKNSYAGLGVNAGVERYWNEKMNLKGEVRYVNLSGSNESTATEMALLTGIVWKW